MLSVSVRRGKIPVSRLSQQIRSFSVSLPDPKRNERREIHSTARRESDAIETTSTTGSATTTTTPSTSISNAMMDRFTVTVEATVSKIFPAGFGWQTGSLVAANQMGYAPDTLNFALMTGTGDAVGVVAGHMTYYAAKKAVLGSKSINLTQELHTGLLLGSAAFCSGTAWQPIVNALQGANLPFAQVFLGTWVGCAAAFYAGLRVGRTILSGPLEYVEEPTYNNSKTDAGLSMAIGGATGFFVGTDASYLPEQNFLIHMVGIGPNVSDFKGCAIAGTSTAMGFLSAQSAMNLAYPAGKSWND